MGTAAFLCLYAVIVFGSSAVGALAAFGGALLALPPLAWLSGDLRLAVITLLLLGFVGGVQLAVAPVRHVQWRPLGGLLGWTAATVPIGLLMATSLPQGPMMIALGVTTLVGGVSGFSAGLPQVASRPFRLVDRFLLLAAGVMHGAFGCGGGPVVLAARHAVPAKESFRGTLFVFWLFLNSLTLAGFAASPSPWAQALLLTAVGLPCMIAGNYVGQRLARRISQRLFGAILAALLAVTGIVTIVRYAPALWSAS